MNERGGSQDAIEVEQHGIELLIEGGRVHNRHAIHHVGEGASRFNLQEVACDLACIERRTRFSSLVGWNPWISEASHMN